MGITNNIPPSRLIQPGVCTSTTRPASPFEGQAIFETDTDRMLIWNGTVWVMPNKPSTNPDGFELVTTATCSSGGTAVGGVVTVGTAVSSVTVTNAFSATYDNYKIIYAGGVASQIINLRMNIGAAVANYYGAVLYCNYANNTPSAIGTNAGSSCTYVGGGDTSFVHVNADIESPFISKPTLVSCLYQDNGAFGSSNYRLADTTSYSSFSLASNLGTITGGTIRIYGYRN